MYKNCANKTAAVRDGKAQVLELTELIPGHRIIQGK